MIINNLFIIETIGVFNISEENRYQYILNFIDYFSIILSKQEIIYYLTGINKYVLFNGPYISFSNNVYY